MTARPGEPRQESPAATAAAAPEPRRRSLLVALLAGILGATAAVLPLVPGLIAFFAPLRKKQVKEAPKNLIRVAMLDAVPDDGLPHDFPVIDTKVDAWTVYPPGRVGLVYLIRNIGDSKPRCFSATCPHLSCSVDFKPAVDQFQCPCHASAFSLSGQVLFGPSPRPLDELEVEIRNGTEVWIAYKKFRSGIEEPVEA